MRKLTLAAVAAFSLLLTGTSPAALDTKNFDLTAKPQDDFYRYANGAWLKNNPVPPEFASWGAFAELRDLSVINLHIICERVAAKQNGVTAIEKMVGDFYASGMDEAAVNAAGAKPLQPELDRIAAIKTPADFLAALAHLHSLGVGGGFRFGSSPDRKNSAQELAVLAKAASASPSAAIISTTTRSPRKPASNTSPTSPRC
jgi:putative endopeptidase